MSWHPAELKLLSQETAGNLAAMPPFDTLRYLRTGLRANVAFVSL